LPQISIPSGGAHFGCSKKIQIKLKQGVCHTVALPFALKIYLKAKEEL
jgi:hypothetical protein